jgi:hypothetical protein
MIWVYGLGFAFIHGAYVDLMRSKGSAAAVNLIFECIAGVAYIVFFIWGFFVFEWWVPIVMPLVGIVAATLVARILGNFPHLFLMIGCGLCSFSLLTH